jgi:hypothetical protein
VGDLESARPLILVALQVVFWAMLLLLVPTAFLSVRMWRILRDRHPATWEDLGEPKISRLSIQMSSRLATFVRRGEYEPLADNELSWCARGLRIAERIYSAGFVALFLLVIAAAIGAQH